MSPPRSARPVLCLLGRQKAYLLFMNQKRPRKRVPGEDSIEPGSWRSGTRYFLTAAAALPAMLLLLLLLRIILLLFLLQCLSLLQVLL